MHISILLTPYSKVLLKSHSDCDTCTHTHIHAYIHTYPHICVSSDHPSHTDASSSPAPLPNWSLTIMGKSILLFGDSITQGGWAPGGWAGRLAWRYVRRADVYNRGYVRMSPDTFTHSLNTHTYTLTHSHAHTHTLTHTHIHTG